VASTTIAISLLVLTGWFLGIHPLVSVVPGLPSMKFNTALCFLLSGGTLMLHTSLALRPLTRFLLTGLPFLTIVISILTLLQYYSGLNFGIDEWCVKDIYTRTNEGGYPGRMAHATALSFTIFSFVMLYTPAKSKTTKEFMQALLLSVGVVAFVAFWGYVFGVPSLYKISFLSTMSVHTAFLFLLLSFAASLLQPQSGLTGLFLSRNVGGEMLRQVVPVLVLSAVVLGYLRLYAFRQDTVPDEFGIALAAVAYLIVAVSAVAFTAVRLNKTDVVLVEAEQKLAELNKNLEQIIELRTNELKLSEGKFQSAFNYSAIGMALVSTEGKWMEVNKSLCKILGYDPQEFYQLTFQDITHPDDLDADLKQVRGMLAGEITTYQMEKRYFHKNSSQVWAKLSVSMLHNSNGTPFCFLSQVEDITAQKMAEQQLIEVNRELSTILNSATHVSIIGTDVKGTITHFSKGAETLLGYTASEMVGLVTPQIIHLPEEVAQHGKVLSVQYGKEITGFDVFVERAKHEEYDTREWTYIRKDGSRFPVQLVVTAVRNHKNELTGFLGVATDLTKTKQIEAEQRKVAELEAKNKEMEQFTYIASHDLQEPLRTVNNLTEMLDKRYSDKLDDEGRMMLSFTRNSALRMSELIAGLLFYSRLGKERSLEQFEVRQVINEVLQDMQQTIRETKAQVVVGAMPTIRGYKMELRVLFQNLLSNAIKFKKKDMPPQIAVKCIKEQGKYIFSVTDNGIGISAKDLHKVFILFKRLHNHGDYPGTGIGLAHCKKIVELHGGTIWVESTPGNGSIFYFTIPI
jgi:PAS domain S-box-containing protein